MPDWNRAERTRVTVEYEIPVTELKGARWSQVSRALDAASGEYFKLYARWPSDDAMHVRITDNAIVIYFEKSNQLT